MTFSMYTSWTSYASYGKSTSTPRIEYVGIAARSQADGRRNPSVNSRCHGSRFTHSMARLHVSAWHPLPTDRLHPSGRFPVWLAAHEVIQRPRGRDADSTRDRSQGTPWLSESSTRMSGQNPLQNNHFCIFAVSKCTESETKQTL